MRYCDLQRPIHLVPRQAHLSSALLRGPSVHRPTNLPSALVCGLLNVVSAQAGTLAALLSLCEHPAVPALVVEAGGLPVMTEYMTTARDVATR